MRSPLLIPLSVASVLTFGPSDLSRADDIAIQPVAGAPLPNLTPTEVALFELGRVRFLTSTPVADGLGPAFNKAYCAACHDAPVGGGGVISTTLFGQEGPRGFDPMLDAGGPHLQVVAIAAGCEEEIGAGANVLTVRVTIGMLGYGLVEAIPDRAILALEDPDDADNDGVRGRAQWVDSIEIPGTVRVGRFGWKAQWATILHATAQAASDEIGLTSRFFPVEHAPGGDAAILLACDDVPDPEIVADASGLDDLDRLTAFQRFLAPPPQTPRTGMRGEVVFHTIGCAACHVPAWTTADDPALPAVLRAQSIRPYSDFLLHQMGASGDPFPLGVAEGGDVRTPPLWNLRARQTLWHDGRVAGGSFADRIAGPDGVISLHAAPGSEGSASAAAFLALPESDRSHVVAFLDSLGRREFDADGDGDLDAVDIEAFVACVGNQGMTADDACAIHDIDGNGMLDALDAGAFVTASELKSGDCDGDGASDLVEVLLGAPDRDGDRVPDDCEPCGADLDRSGAVGPEDLGLLLGAWGTPGADVNGDGTTAADDLSVLLARWGPCR